MIAKIIVIRNFDSVTSISLGRDSRIESMKAATINDTERKIMIA
jgi:hypothetical protein